MRPNTILLLLIALFMLLDTGAQSLPDMTLNKNFDAQVKSIDEFIQRFNGEEIRPDLKNENRTMHLVALFDYQMRRDNLPDSLFKRKVMNFVNQIETSGVKIKLTDDKFFAEADIAATILGKAANVTLIFQSQTYNNDKVRWAIVGVRGLAKMGFIDTRHFYGISPVEHETHFMSIGDIFMHNTPEIWGYRGKETAIDELSVFLTYAQIGKVRINNVNNLTMHCLEIPNYVFTINEVNRNGKNSGWLISSFTNVIENKKQEYIIKLIGK